jgi:spermidine synthase
MSLTPLEVFTLRPGFKKAKGRCLVGGLGLGYFTKRILERKQVEKVTVVEKNPHVAEFFGAPLRDRVEIIVDDVWEFLKSDRLNSFDSILLDTWSSAGDSFEDRKLMEVRQRHPHVWAWAEYDACLYNWR